MSPQLISFPRFLDGRGWFSQQWQESWKDQYGIPNSMVQTNMAYSSKRNTIRGLHAQLGLAKLVTVISGTIMDICVSKDGEVHKFILSGDFPQSLYVPDGYYHGYKTLTDNTIMMYQQDGFWNKSLEYGVKWNDIILNIDWELNNETPIVSDKDNELPGW